MDEVIWFFPKRAHQKEKRVFRNHGYWPKKTNNPFYYLSETKQQIFFAIGDYREPSGRRSSPKKSNKKIIERILSSPQAKAASNM